MFSKAKKEAVVGLLVLLLVLGFVPQAAAQCLVTTSTGFPITPILDPVNGMCARGFYCPNCIVANASTWPRVCPATDECFNRRLNSEFCEPQGLYEPVPCEKGYYCPTGYRKIRCPDGYSCIIGSTSPKKCSLLSACPEGTDSEYYMGGILWAGLADILVVAVFLAFKAYERHRISSLNLTVTAMNADAQDLPKDPQSKPRDKSKLIRAFKKSRGDLPPLRFRFKDLSLTIPAAKGQPEKVVLSKMSGVIRPGRLTAIMGPSQSGKSVFFNTLLGKIDPSWERHGSLTINGITDVTKFKHVIGVTPQEDVLHRELTVEYNLFFASETRLPQDWSFGERTDLRDGVLEALGLSHVRHLPIGDEETRGVSGGQRRRTSIGVEMATAPLAVFLDEPTTGLDAATALDLCATLKEIAQETELTVAMIIHQPRVEIWDAIDDVILIGMGGRTVYAGPRDGAKKYFEERVAIDFSFGNPADIIIDAISCNGERLAQEWEKAVQEREEMRDPNTTPLLDDPRVVPPPRGASFIKQVGLTHFRSLLKQLYSMHTLLLDIILGMLASTMMGTAAIAIHYNGVVVLPYSLISPKIRDWVIPMMTMFYQIAIAATAGASGIRTFGSEIAQYWREASAGHNKIAYFLGNSSADLYRLVLSSLHFTVVAYLMWSPYQEFGRMFLCIFLIFVAVDSQSAMLGMILNPTTAPLMASIAAVFMSLLNGYPQIPVIGPVSYAWWTSEAMFDDNTRPVEHIFRTRDVTANFFGYKVHWFAYDILITCGIIILYRIIAFCLMVFLNREKQR